MHRGLTVSFFLAGLFVRSVTGAGCSLGLIRSWGGSSKGVYTTAWADADGTLGSEVMEFRGSFVARVNGGHVHDVEQHLWFEQRVHVQIEALI
jgi:hypothetical protein